jgi:hypothetical protein
MPVLRRPHDHHRDLRARLFATHALDQLDQDRHLMTITASARKTVPLRADLLAATPALAQMAARGPQLTQSSSINKAAFNRPYLLIHRTSLNQCARSPRRYPDIVPTAPKSP